MSDAVSQNPYDVLAPIYDDAGFSNYAAAMTPRLLTFLQQQGWLGRRVLDLGCGTGLAAATLSRLNMDVFAIDSCASMLELGERRLLDTGYHVNFIEQDIREADYPDELDLILCLGNVLNEMRSLKEIETIFMRAYKALSPGKTLLFDLTTIRGLAEQFAHKESVLDISDRLFFTVQNYFNYETIAVQQKIVYFMETRAGWERADATLMLRGFPFTGMVRLLEKIGFEVKGAYDTRLANFDPVRDPDGRFLLIANRKA